MPTVPTRDNLNATPNTTTSFRFRNTTSQAEAAAPGQQLIEQGRSLERLGTQQMQYQLELAREANQLRVDDAMTQAREEALRLQHDPKEGYETLKGYDALERPDGKPLTDEYSAKLEERLSSIQSTLGNEDQRIAFQRQSNALMARFRENTIQHEGREFSEYSQSVRRGTIQNRTQEIALNYKNDEAVEDAILSIKVAADDLARQQGKSAPERDALSRKAVSKGHMVVIETAIQKEDNVYADEYFKKNAKNMDADDILRVNTVLGEQLDTKLAVEVASKVIDQQRPNMVTSNKDRAFNVAIQAESGGRHFGAPGSVAGPEEPTTSKAGAIGIAQVLPTTGPEAAKLAGLEWDEERFRNDPTYNYALGQAYFEKQLQDFDGSLAKAYAAYNAGPGATRKAIEEAGADWLSALPKETQDYVSKNIKAFSAGKGQNKKPTLADIQDQVREEVGNDNPRRLRLALAQAEQEYDAIENAVKVDEERAVGDAMRELIANGGDYQGLSPLMRSSIPPQEVGKVMDFAKKISKGSDTTNLTVYNELTQHPDVLKNMTDDQFIALRGELDESDFKHFSARRAELINGGQTKSEDPNALNTSAIKRALDNRFLELGIKAKDDPELVGQIQKFVDQSILAAQNESGKKFSDRDTEDFVNALFAEKTTYDNWFNTQGPIITMTYSDIPSRMQKELKQAFKARGVEATKTEILEAYKRQLLFTRTKQNDRGSY